MQSTFGIKLDCRRMTTVLLMLFGMMSVISCQWMIDSSEDVVLSEGDSCRIRTGEPGKCTLLEKCDPYYKGLQKKTIEYSFLVRCSLIRFKEVICCPVSEKPTKASQPQIVTTATTTSTTTTTTTMRPIVIGGVTLTGNEEFVDLSKILRRTSTSTTTTTRRPRRNRWENGVNVQWPNAQTSDAEWIAPTNQQEPSSRNIVQFPLQPNATNTQNVDRNLNEALTDLLGPFQFRPGSEDPLLAGTSTLRNIVRNELDEASNVWTWSEATTPRTTTTSTTATPDWIQPILPDWMKAALSSSTTQRSQTADPILPDWMQAALDNASTASSSIRDTTFSPVIQTLVSLDHCIEANQTSDSITNKTSCFHATKGPQIDVRLPDIPRMTTTVRTVTTRNENERPSQAACRSYADFNQASLTFHILDGVPVAPGDFPHMGALVYPSEGGEGINVRCGSSLISNLYVMTAAHCVNDPVAQPTMVRFGVVQLTATDDGIIPVDVQIEEIFMHPDYRSPRRYHDIAIIKLQQPVEYTPYIRPACLYSELPDIDSSTTLTVIGWGVTDVQTRSRSGILLAANLTSVPLMECNRSYIEVGVSRSLSNGLDEGQYCAFDAGLRKDACQADSGGPLQLVRNKESSIVGVVSFGQSCASTTPSVYARVAYYLSWIESIVWPPS